MTESAENYSAQPGWYPDPAGSPRQRWWDGREWTEHLYDSSHGTYGVTATPGVGPQTPVFNIFIWAIVLLPILSLVFLISIDMRRYALRSMSGDAAILDPSFAFLSLLGWGVTIASFVLAFFDWRKLKKDGFVRPFHWAWVFLSSAVYVIGRSVIVRRRSGRGFAPIWVWAAVMVVSTIVAIAKLGELLSTVMSTIPVTTAL